MRGRSWVSRRQAKAVTGDGIDTRGRAWNGKAMAWQRLGRAMQGEQWL
nr:MAG TPA: hypothetical protein [Caudoviricetes sp.]